MSWVLLTFREVEYLFYELFEVKMLSQKSSWKSRLGGDPLQNVKEMPPLGWLIIATVEVIIYWLCKSINQFNIDISA